MSDDIYFIQVEGGDKELMDDIVEQAAEWEFDDNIIVVPKEVEPLSRGEAKEYLLSMADALDMSVSDER